MFDDIMKLASQGGVEASDGKYAHYDPDTGQLLGYYTNDVHGTNIPEPHLRITNEQWQHALQTNANYVVNGELVTISETPTLTPEERDAIWRGNCIHALMTYVDPYAGNVLRWSDLSEERRSEIKEYRNHVLNLHRHTPKDYDESLLLPEWVDVE